MRISKTLISGAVAAVAVAGSANASVWLQFASLSADGSVAGPGPGSNGTNVSSANPETVGSPSGTGGSWAADRYLAAAFTNSSMTVSGGNATFTSDVWSPVPSFSVGGSTAMRWAFADAKDLTGIVFRLNVASVASGQMSVNVYSDTAGTQILYGLGKAVTVGDNDFAMIGNLAGARSVKVQWSLDYGATSAQTAVLSGIQYNGVPAPGAIALLGAAGLVGGRRRRD
jgi:hypothetical protein